MSGSHGRKALPRKGEKKLALIIKKIFDDSDSTYGYRRITRQLARWGVQAGPELVRRLMRELGLVACQPRPWRPSTTRQGRSPADPGPGEPGFLCRRAGRENGRRDYLHPDLAGLGISGYGHRLRDPQGDRLGDGRQLQDPAHHCRYRDGREECRTPRRCGLSFRSGSNYTSAEFAAVLDRLGIRQSVGRTGICFDNALAESFNASLKVERVHRTVYPTREKARQDVARYIELRYNRTRLHSALGYRTPQEVHDEYLTWQRAAWN